jgi:Xaa-Pro aminopeptidase
VSWVGATRDALASNGSVLVGLDSNPVDAVWRDRPRPSVAPLRVYPEEVSGKSSSDKRRAVSEWLAARSADTVVLAALDSIAWTFNLRGQDVEHTPVALAYALVNADGTADLCVAPEKLSEPVVQHLGSTVRLHPRNALGTLLRALAGKRVAVDAARAPAAIFEALEAAGATVLATRDPVMLPKAIKNAVEISGHRAAQVRDGAAVSRFLHWLSREAPRGTVTELSAAAKLQEFREATGVLLDLSFDTISGFGPNGAVVHYRVTPETNRQIVAGSLYLVDSGGQYADGTTDVTRTVAIGAPQAEMREQFTRVLKGHIALARAVFPAGTSGGQLDTLARQYLWEVGLDYAHGSGHGVGAYLGVHEGPQRIARTGDCSEPLVPNMIVSNEPGYYKSGEYGIRIENLMLVVEREVECAEAMMLGFETITFVPISRTLIEANLLTAEERAWIDGYHADVARIVGPQLDCTGKAWLLEATRPLD